MLSRKLYRLFVEKKVSMWQIDLWGSRNWPKDQVDNLIDDLEFRGGEFDCVAFGFFVLALGVILGGTTALPYLTPFSLVFLLGVVMVSLGLCAFTFRKHPCKLFLKDIEELARHFPNCGMMSKSELEKLAMELLVRWAMIVVQIQNEAKIAMDVGDFDLSSSKVAEAKKEKEMLFKPIHGTLFRFGLVEEKWDIYFAKATEEIALAHHVAGLTSLPI